MTSETPTTATSPLRWTWGEWAPLYHGIERAINLSPNVPFPAVPIPKGYPLPTINLLRVRMDDPHITTCSTPESGLSPSGVPLSQFLETTFNAKNEMAIEGIVGINANFFTTATPIIAARTAVGVSYDPHYLYLLTIDGLETFDLKGPYYGATDFDAAVLLLLAGATDAMNLDGGGSTTMGRIDRDGFTLMNVPYGNDSPPSSERSVGNCFAVISRAPLAEGSDER
jgi:hypothetical protein